MANILALICGGTIDAVAYNNTATFKQYNQAPQNITPLARSMVKPYLLAHYAGKCEVAEMMLKDSKSITPADIANVLSRARGATQKSIMLTFGTDAMADTARYFAHQTKGLDKTIIFTGAFEPIAHGSESDGYRNITCAMNALLEGKLKPGVYVAMPTESGESVIFTITAALKKQVTVDSVSQKQHKYFVGQMVGTAA